MAEANLNVVLRLIDEASSGLKAAMDSAKEGVNKVGDSTTKAKPKIQGFNEQLKQTSRDFRSLRQTAFVATAALAVVIASVKSASEYNQKAKKTFDEFTTATKSLSAVLGTALQPALHAVSKVIEFLRDTLEAATAGFVKVFSFIAELQSRSLSDFWNVGENIKNSWDVANRAAEEYLGTLEETRALVDSGLTLEKQEEQVVNLDKIVVTASKKMKSGWEGVADAVSILGDALAGAEEMGKGWAKAAAAISMAMAVINTAEGITRAFKDYRWPFSIVVAGIIAAAGAIQIATIAAQKFHEGGMIRAHDGLAIDEVPIIAQTGEGILSRRGMAALGGAGMLNRLNSGQASSGDVYIEVNYPKFNSREDMDNLIQQLGREIQSQLRYARSA